VSKNSATKKLRMVFRPAEFVQGLSDSRQRKSDNIEIAALDAWNITPGASLDSVRAGLVESFASRKVEVDFVLGELGEMNERGFDKGAPLAIRQSNKGNTCEDRMSAAGKLFEHVACVVGGAGLAEDAAFEGDNSVGGEHDRWTDGSRGNEFGFGFGEAKDVVVR